jgi:hypothetical protein
MTGAQYLSTLNARIHAIRTSLAAAVVQRGYYETNLANWRRTHGPRPTSAWTSVTSPVQHSYYTYYDMLGAQRMSAPYERLRIAVNRGVEAINMRAVTAPIPAAVPGSLRALASVTAQGAEQLRWYFNSPASRHDPNRSWFERVTRFTIVNHPYLRWAVPSSGISESQAGRNVASQIGVGLPERPSDVMRRTDPAQQAAQREALTAGIKGDPHGTLATVGRETAATAQAAWEAAAHTATSAAHLAQTGSHFTTRVMGGRGGITFSDVVVVAGVGAIAVGGLYLFLKTRPSLIAAGKMLKAVRNPDGSISYTTYDDGECG